MESELLTTAVDSKTAEAFAQSWNNLPTGSVYTFDQFLDWLSPLSENNVREKSVLELGCGNGSLLVHMQRWNPSRLVGVDLGDSVISARRNLAGVDTKKVEIIQQDLTKFISTGFDIVYCIGVLHHLAEPKAGFRSVLNNVKLGGHFHCWVYGREGNAVVRWLVDPLRRITSRLPWWFTKYVVATVLAIPFFCYAKICVILPSSAAKVLPLFEYCCWIAKREFSFFRHVAFDQLVTPRTVYLSRQEIEAWLSADPRIDLSTTYLLQRNANSWKFGGKVKQQVEGA